MEKIPAACTTAPLAAAIGALSGRVPGLAPEPLQVSHFWCRSNCDDFRRAVGGFQQVQRDFAMHVAALAGAAASAAAAEEVAEESLAEDVAEGLEDIAHVVEVRGPAACQPGVAVAVVRRPLLRDGSAPRRPRPPP